MNKDVRQLQRKLRQAGWRIERTNGNHYLYIGPEGQRIYGASTPSDWRWMKQFNAVLKRSSRI